MEKGRHRSWSMVWLGRWAGSSSQPKPHLCLKLKDMREAASPSFFNPAEAVVVLDYIKQLVAEGVKPRDIGVITPYRLEAATLSIFDSPPALTLNFSLSLS